MPLLKRVETLDDHHRPDVTYINPEHVIKIYQVPVDYASGEDRHLRQGLIARASVGSIICLDTRSGASVSKVLTMTDLSRLLTDLGPFVSVGRVNSAAVEYVRLQSIVAVTTHDYFKPLAERTEGWLHLRDGTQMLVTDRAAILKKIETAA